MQTSVLARSRTDVEPTVPTRVAGSWSLVLAHKSTWIRLKLLHAQIHAQPKQLRVEGGGEAGLDEPRALQKTRNMKRALPVKDIDYATAAFAYPHPPVLNYSSLVSSHLDLGY